MARSRRPVYDPDGPLCNWGCGRNVGKGNPLRTWYNWDEVPGAMAPVCSDSCDHRPDGAVTFNYYPLMVGHGGGAR